MTNNELLLIIAVILFCVAATIRFMARSVDGALVALGLALFALAFVVNP